MAEEQRLIAIAFLCLLSGLGAWTQAQPGLNVTVLETSPVTVARGSGLLTLSCKMNAGLQAVLSHSISWLKEPRVAAVSNESVSLSLQQTILLDQPQAARFDVQFRVTKESVVAVLTIENVEDADDGRYVCQLTTIQGSKVVASDDIDVIVPNRVERMTLKMGSKILNTTTKVTPGLHRLKCVAQGFNPNKETVALESKDLRVRSGNVMSFLDLQASSSAGAPRYGRQVIGEVNISMADNGSTLKCVSKIAGSFVSSTFHVVPTPTVHCDDVKVHRSDLHVQVACEVMHVDVSVEDYIWELTDTGIIYSTEGPSHNNTVVSEKVSDTKLRVVLRLDVVRWGKTRTLFRMTAVTDVGDVSDDAYIIVVSDEDAESEDKDDSGHGHGEKEGDGDGNGDGGGDGHGHGHGHTHSANGTSRSQAMFMMLWNHLLLLLLMLVFSQP